MVMAVVDVIKESFAGTSSNTIHFQQPVEGIVLRNKGTEVLIMRVNDIEVEVPAGEVFSGWFDSFTTLNVEGSSPYSGFVTQAVRVDARAMANGWYSVTADEESGDAVRIETVTELPPPSEAYSSVILKLTGTDVTEGFYLSKRLADNTYTWVQFG